MTAVSIAFDGTRANDAEATTNWTAASATVTLETDFVYQGSGSVSAQIKTTESGFYYRNSAVSYDFTTPRVWIAKIIATNKNVLDGNGVTLEIGTGARTNYYRYFVFSATSYPIPGGWQIVPIDPNISGYRSATVGTPTLTTIDMFGIQADFSVTSKSQNVAVDAVDHIASGTGLTLTGGDGADADGTFANFVTSDEGTSSNRWGIVTTREGVLYITGTLQIGSGTAAVFTDSNRTLVFPDGRVAAGFFGTKWSLANATSQFSVTSCAFIGRGALGTTDTRPDHTVTSTTGNASSFTGCTFNVFRNITYTSKVTATSCSFLNGLKLTQAGSTITGCSFTGFTGGSAVAYVLSDDPSKISSCSFTFNSAGHAIEISTAGTYSFSGNTFTNYGAGGTNDAAIYNNSGGSVTLNITGGGSTPTVRNGAGASTTVNNAVTLTVTVKDANSVAISGARVGIYTDNTSETELMNSTTNGSGIASTSYAYVSDQPVFIRIRAASGTPAYQDVETSGTITSSGLSVQITMQTDPNV
jgi:hypothetical protein